MCVVAAATTTALSVSRQGHAEWFRRAAFWVSTLELLQGVASQDRQKYGGKDVQVDGSAGATTPWEPILVA
jgi:hypothetical protein